MTETVHCWSCWHNPHNVYFLRRHVPKSADIRSGSSRHWNRGQFCWFLLKMFLGSFILIRLLGGYISETLGTASGFNFFFFRPDLKSEVRKWLLHTIECSLGWYNLSFVSPTQEIKMKYLGNSRINYTSTDHFKMHIPCLLIVFIHSCLVDSLLEN